MRSDIQNRMNQAREKKDSCAWLLPSGRPREQLHPFWEFTQNHHSRISIDRIVVSEPVDDEPRIETVEVARELQGVVLRMRLRVAKGCLVEMG